MRILAPVALAASLLALLLSGTIWLVFLGAPLGVVGAGLGLVALRAARRRGDRGRVALTAIWLGALAILALPVILVGCNAGWQCV